MSRTRSLTTATAASLALTLALVACDGKTDEPAASSTTTSASKKTTSDSGGSGSPTAAAPTPDVPAPNPADYPGMDQQTEKGAQQAFRYYWASLVHAYQTGNTDAIDAMALRDCSYCTGARREVVSLNNAGTLWSSTTIEDDKLSSDSGSGSEYVIEYSFYLSAHVEPGASDGEQQEPRRHYGSAGGVLWSDNQWHIKELDIVDAGTA